MQPLPVRPTPEEFRRDHSMIEIPDWKPRDPLEFPEIPPVPAGHVRVWLEVELVDKAANGNPKVIIRYLDRPV